MSNRKKPTNRKLVAERALSKVEVPDKESVVLKRVPAKIKWAGVDSVDRDDEEIIGEAIIYDDGTNDLIVSGSLSDDAKKLIYGLSEGFDMFSIAEQAE